MCEGFTERGEEEVGWWWGLLRREQKGLEGGAPRVLGFIKSDFIVGGRTKGLRGNFVFHQTQDTFFFFSNTHKTKFWFMSKSVFEIEFS